MVNTTFERLFKLGATALLAILPCAAAQAQPVALPDFDEVTDKGLFPSDNRWSFAGSTSAGGINGVNRRVVVSGYQAASGTFPEPTFWINPESKGPLGNEGLIQQTNKPSFYLGGWTADHTVIIDAGMQWEPEPVTKDNIRYDPGWSLFINISMATRLTLPGNTETTLGKLRFSGNPQPPWRQGKGQLGTTQLGFTLNADGDVSITAIPGGGAANKSVGPIAVLWPKKNDGSINLESMEVRRVVALTQAQGSDVLEGLTRTPDGGWEVRETSKVNFDGTWVHGLTNTGATVTKFTSDTDGKLTKGATNNWPTSDATSAVIPYAKNIDGPWIIEFSNNANSKRHNDADDLGRYLGKYIPNYATEIVDIEVMKKPATLTGKITKSGQSYPFD